MSTFEVTVEQLTVLPHPNAERLELAQVGYFRAVVGKGLYKTGDFAVYIPEQAILPDDLIEELNLTGKLAGSGKNRVKAVHLRGELSQGIIARPSALVGIHYSNAAAQRTNFADLLGITKWVPEVPASMSGEVEPDSNLVRWVDIESIKKFPGLFTEGEEVSATEKLHGTATLYTYRTVDGKEIMSSKGLAAKGLALRDAESNLYWRVARGYNLAEFSRRITDALRHEEPISHIGIFGETFGAGVQDLSYGANGKVKKPGYYIFDIAVRLPNGENLWVNTDTVRTLVEEHGSDLDLKMVPELYRGPYDPQAIAEVAEGKETISGKELHVREGVVVRPLFEGYSDVTGGRKIGKWVSEGYLTRKGGTEFE